MNTKKIEKGIELVLEGLVGPDWQLDINYVETPQRVARFYKELFSRDGSELTTFPDEFDQMIVLAHHLDWALCPHHLLPVKLDISLAYIPNRHVLGLSKLARLVRACLNKPISQETLTDLIADRLNDNVTVRESQMLSPNRPFGTAVLIYGEHACMQIRGVKTTAYTVTCTVRGAFREKPEVKEEFLALVRR